MFWRKKNNFYQNVFLSFYLNINIVCKNIVFDVGLSEHVFLIYDNIICENKAGLQHDGKLVIFG